ncbi:hypothetical protein [Balneola sp. EhC07]|uniref:hypothetical protein n=1 Tax=Balneola sp. EhC07 TaxID=1849360 RepID=UPI0012902A4A|nr:hypothetical protein [Balneola sp. EhC07]
MRTTFLLILIYLITTAVYSQNHNLETLKSDKCNFSASMPKNVSLATDSVYTQGQKVHTITYTSWSKEQVTYSITCSDFPPAHLFDTPRKTFTMLRSAAVPAVDGKLEDMQSITAFGHNGISYTEKSDLFSVYNWVLIVDKKIFQMYVSGLNHDAHEEAKQFFEDFKLISQ